MPGIGIAVDLLTIIIMSAEGKGIARFGLLCNEAYISGSNSRVPT
jgi:hypothetical protein